MGMTRSRKESKWIPTSNHEVHVSRRHPKENTFKTGEIGYVERRSQTISRGHIVVRLPVWDDAVHSGAATTPSNPDMRFKRSEH